ncbi:8904_t:CDS:2 [Funneliformis geosporum]|nr:8904_t:CDS:2 [Funneliformis geosporum]
MNEEIVSLEEELNILIQTPRKRTEPNSGAIGMEDDPNFI